MKIAVFATGWNGEYLRDMYHGLENSQKEFHDSIHLYASFGRLGSGDSFNKSEFDFFELADMSEYDGFLYPSTTIKEGDVKQRLLERIIESKKPCVSLEEEIPGLSLSESIRAKPCGRSCGILPGFMESGRLVLLTA
ncbi:MAG: hypothetical protein ACLROW_06465 [Roseburia faecis]